MEDTPTIGAIIQTVLAILFFVYLVALYLFDRKCDTSNFWWTSAGLFVGDGVMLQWALSKFFFGEEGMCGAVIFFAWLMGMVLNYISNEFVE